MSCVANGNLFDLKRTFGVNVWYFVILIGFRFVLMWTSCFLYNLLMFTFDSVRGDY
jgi:hypothetical protein